MPITFAGAFFLVFISQYVRWVVIIPRERLVLFFVFPLLTQVVVWTNGLHGLMYRDLVFVQGGGFTFVNSWQTGIWYWLHTAYHYGLIVLGLGLSLVSMQRAEEPERTQAWYLFLGSIFGVGANLITTLELGLAFDITPVGFTLMCLIWSWALLQNRLIDLGAVARFKVVETLEEAVIALDRLGCIVDLNPEAQNFLVVPMEEARGKPGAEAIRPWKKLSKWLNQDEGVATEVTLLRSGLDYEFELIVTPLVDERGVLNGRVIQLRDITGSNQTQEALKRANRNLLEEIRERKNAEKAVFELATVDPLTNVFNRRHFLELAEREFKRSVRYKRALSAIMLDVDHLKRVNDECGYRTGDLVLAALATRVTKYLRSTDFVGRFGGEEFVFLLPETGHTHAEYVAERLRKEIDSLSFPTDQGLLHITVSIGIASLDDEVKSVDKLLEMADDALSAAKQAGRNQVMVYRSGVTSLET
jgi:diguanylate cyclase (GGDEF)-like protein